MAMKKTVEFAQAEQIRRLQEQEEYDFQEIRRCESDCPHFDLINQCCWLSTANTGLMTTVQEFDECFHGIKEDS